MWNVKCAGPAPVLRAATGPTGFNPKTEGSDAEGGPSVFQMRHSRFEAEVGPCRWARLTLRVCTANV
jgi:hypothetical protein